MITHPNINPVAFRILDWPVHWYGIMWCAAFLAAAAAGKRLAQKPALAGAPPPEELIAAGILGALAGGRLGYALFYDFSAYAAEPWRILQIWKGGMSFHGGLLGVVLAAFFTAKKTGAGFLRTADFAAMLAPIGLGLGRIGNFINGELPGRPAPPDLPWAMIFPGDDIARHPSPLYQAFLEGAVLAAVMLFFAAGKRRPPGFLAAVFLVGYGICRVFSEFFRQPDAHIGLLIGGFSMGQLLSAPMLLLGFGLLFWQTGAAKKIRPRFVAFSAALSKISKTIRAQINSGGAYFAAAPAPATNPGGGEIAAAAAKMEKMKKTGNSENPEKTVNPETMEFTAPVKPFWKKIFATKSVAAPEKTKIRAASRRQKRRQKKKKRD